MTNERSFDDDETTPPERRVPSPEALSLANLGLALNRIAEECAEAARLRDELPIDERGHQARGLSAKFRELGDLCHVVAQSLYPTR